MKIVYTYETTTTIKIQNIYIIPKRYLILFAVHPFCYPSTLGSHSYYFCLYGLTLNFYKKNHTVCILLYLASFTQHIDLEIYPHCSTH